MHLGCCRTLAEMVPPKKTSLPRNDPLETEPPATSMIGSAGTSNHIGVTDPILSPVVTLMLLPVVVVSLLLVENVPITPRVTQTAVGGPKCNTLFSPMVI